MSPQLDVNEHVELQMGSFPIDPVLPVRPCEYNTIVFTADMIKPVFYNADNFKPICIDNVSVPQELLDLASLSPSFSPTPTFAQPPDGNILHKDLMEYKRVLSWKYHFRMLDLKAASSIEDFLSQEFSTFQKDPWYKKSSLTPPPLPPSLEQAFSNLYNSIMQPKNWYKYQSNLSQSQRSSMALAKTLPSQNVGIYCQDKSSRICFASLSETNAKVEQVLSDSSKYKKLRFDHATTYQRKIECWYSKYKSSLISIKDDISTFLLPENVSTPHLKVLIKTHK